LKTEDFETIVDYTTVLDNFSGPLDLLLYLINKEEIEIKDIFVSQVTEQFLDYMRGLAYIDVEKVGEYLNIAATILKIKAQSLIPNLLQDEAVDAEIEEDKAQLIRALEEFRLIKEETKKLKELETIGFYFKEPDKNVGEPRVVYTDFNLDGLVKAFSAFLLKQETKERQEEVREIPKDEYTVEEKVTYILESLENTKSVHFEELFRPNSRKPEIITTFQALLELLKHQYLRIEQDGIFGEITITLNPDRKEDETLGEIDEYN